MKLDINTVLRFYALNCTNMAWLCHCDSRASLVFHITQSMQSRCVSCHSVSKHF